LTLSAPEQTPTSLSEDNTRIEWKRKMGAVETKVFHKVPPWEAAASAEHSSGEGGCPTPVEKVEK